MKTVIYSRRTMQIIGYVQYKYENWALQDRVYKQRLFVNA